MTTNVNLSYMKKTQLFDDSALSQYRFAANKENLYSDLNGEGVILSLKNGKYYGVNAVGASIWMAVQTPASLQDIQVSIMQEYEVDEGTCRQEVLSFLEQMIEEDLVEILNEKIL